MISLRQHILAPQYKLDRVKLSIQIGPLGSLDRPDGERLLRLWNAAEGLSIEEAEQRLRSNYQQQLEAIEEFGYNRSGHGFSCARMASTALGKKPR